jgi:hypothetical protein
MGLQTAATSKHAHGRLRVLRKTSWLVKGALRHPCAKPTGNAAGDPGWVLPTCLQRV